MKCPSFENLIAYLEGEMDVIARQPVQAHLDASCTRCEASRVWYRRVKTITAHDDLVEPPPWVLRRASKLFETPGLGQGFVERAGRVVAALIFDSFASANFAGARSLSTAERQLLYRAESYSIDLQLAEAIQTRRELSGQILRDGEFKFDSVGGVEINLIRDDQTILSTETNKFGEFSIASVESGNYDLHIQTREISITVVGLPVA